MARKWTITGKLFSDIQKGLPYPQCQTVSESIYAGSALLAIQKFRELHPDYQTIHAVPET